MGQVAGLRDSTTRRRKCRNVVAWNWHSTKVTTSKQKWPTKQPRGSGRQKWLAGNVWKIRGKTGWQDNRKTGETSAAIYTNTVPRTQGYLCRYVGGPKDPSLQVCHQQYCNHKLCKKAKTEQHVTELNDTSPLTSLSYFTWTTLLLAVHLETRQINRV